MASTDACFKRITNELVKPGVGFWSVSQYNGSTLSGQVYFRGERFADASMLGPQGDGRTYFAGVSGRSLNAVLNDVCALMDEVAEEVGGLTSEPEVEDAPEDETEPEEAA